MAKYYDIDTSVRINGGLTVNGDTSIPSSYNIYIGGNITGNSNLYITSTITGNTINGTTANITDIYATGTLSGGTIKGNGNSITVTNNTSINGGTSPISNGWAYTHEQKVGSLGHIPTGGSLTTFLRGDNTWVVPTDTNNYDTGISSTSGGNGTLTVSRNGLSALTLDLAHNHDSSYYTKSQIDTQMGGKDYYGKWNLLAGATTTGISSSSNVTVTGSGATTVSLAGSTLTISSTDTNTWRGIDTTPVSGDTVNSIASSWAYTHQNTYGMGAHVPSGGSNSTFLRGDNTWATPTDTNTYVTGLSSTAGGNGTLTVSRNTGGNLTIDLSHNHDTSYLKFGGGTVTGNLNVTANMNADRYYQNANGTPTSNLGSPSVTEMALFDSQFTNKTWFFDPTKFTFEYTNDGISWTPIVVDNATIANFVSGLNNTTINIPNGCQQFRITIQNDGNYVYLNALYMYWSSQSHSTQVTIDKLNSISQTWSNHTNSTNKVSAWPGHLYLPFSTIPFSNSIGSSSYYSSIRIIFTPAWSSDPTYGTYPIALNGMAVWGGYPSGKRTIYSWDSSKNVTFPAQVTATSFIGSGNSLTVSGTPTNGSVNPINAGWAYTHINSYGLGSHVPTGGTNTTFLRGDGTWQTPTDTNTWRPIDTTPTSGDTANSIASSWAYTHVNTYGLGSHVPTGGSNTTFLRGDGTWVTPTDTDTYVNGISSTAGGNGTLTVSRNSGSNLTLNLAHNHDTVYLGISGTAVNANLLDNIDSSSFVRSDQNDTMTGILTLSGSNATPLVLQRNGTPNINLQFVHSSGSGYLGIDGTGQLMFGTSADLNGTGYKVWHSNIFDPTSKVDNSTFSTHTGNTGVGSHIPVGGTTSQFLRGDGTWQTVSTIDTYVTGISSTSGGNGTLTVSQNQGQSNLTLDLSHNHDGRYLGSSATASNSTLFNNLSSNQFVRSDSTTTISANVYFTSGNGVTFQTDASDSAKIYTEYDGTIASGSARTNLVLYVSDDADDAIVHRVKYYNSGNATDVLTLNYNKATFDSGVGVYVGVNKVWHAGNDGTGSGLDADTIDGIESAKFVRNDTANQVVSSGFTMSGNTYVGGSTSNGALFVRTGAGSVGIQLAGDNAVKQSGVGVYLNASGTATFTGTMTANTIAVTSTSLVNNLNAQMINNVKEPQITKNGSILELGGKGVYTGLIVSAQTVPNMTVQVATGTSYTDSGMRVVNASGTNISFSAPSVTYNRIDSVYIQGSSAGANEGIITVAQGTASVSPVAPSIPSDGILLANVTIRQNAGSILGTDITDMRVWRPFNTSGTDIYVGGTLHMTGALDGSTTIQVNKPFKNSQSNKSVTISSGSTSYTWTHNLNLTNYVVRLSCNSSEPHIYWSNKISNAITVNLDDSYDSDITIDISIEAY